MANYRRINKDETKAETKVETKVESKAKDTTVEETEIIEEKKPRVFAQDDTIPCRSMVNGALYILGARSGILYTWADYGDVEEIEYRDLLYLVRTRNDPSIYAPRIIIEDEDFIEQNKQVKTLYDSMYTTTDIRDIINLPVKQMVAEIEKLPVGVKDSLKGMAATMIDAHQLDSVSKIKALDEVFGTEMILTLVQE